MPSPGSENTKPTPDSGQPSTGPATFSTGRNIGGFSADVTVSEEHTDELQITDHPVETGANVSDHAFKLPMRVVIRVGYSDSSINASGTGYVKDIYDKFVTLQNTRQPFDVMTGKRSYKNMLIQSMATTTDETTENSLILVVTCREVIRVSTKVTSVGSPDQHKSPEKTSELTHSGTVQPVPGSPNTGSGGIPK